MIVLGRAEIEALLEPDALIEAVRLALIDLSAGRASVPPRIASWSAERTGLLGAMVAYVPSLDALAAKLVTVFPQAELSHQAVIAVFDPRTGAPLALLDGTEITAQRTAAGSALATRLLAREDASVLAILGTGVQAESHARYLPRVRRFRELRVAGRDPERTARLAARIGARAARSYEEAVRGADVICATTHAREPVLRGAWLKPGAHVNSVGFHPEGSEIDAEVLRRALLAVESRASAFALPPAGAFELRGMDAKAAVEIGELPSRTSLEQITLYKSVGVAAEDAAAAALVLRMARVKGVGKQIGL
ncbi:MAG TPA: ornithine cyclodeaminase family protein [Myxococcales bacterium]|nr:ornithine cyclodeaminase family protein [Myxococcales bacterium]